MPERIPQSTAKLVVFRAIASSDHFTPATAKTIAITISKNGATSFSNPNAGATNATEMASGFYKFTLDTTDTGTKGPLAWRGAGTGIDDVGDVFEVVNATNAGFTALPDVASGSAGAVITSGTGTGQLSVSSGHALADLDTIKTQAVATTGAGTITFPGAATLASTTNITAGTIGSVTAGVSIANGAITTTTFGAGAIDAAAIAASAIGASELAADAAEEIADTILGRNVAGGSSAGRTVSQALYALRNKVAVAAGTMTVYQTDDTTSSWTAAVSTTAGDPISTIDPA